MNKYYLSGKITGLPPETVRYNFNVYSRELRDYFDAIVINPLKLKPFLVKCWLGYMITDIMTIRCCTHVAFMPNWTDSKGAVIEYFFAKFVFKKVIVFL